MLRRTQTIPAVPTYSITHRTLFCETHQLKRRQSLQNANTPKLPQPSLFYLQNTSSEICRKVGSELTNALSMKSSSRSFLRYGHPGLDLPENASQNLLTNLVLMQGRLWNAGNHI